MGEGSPFKVEVAVDLEHPLKELAGALQQSPSWIVNRALEEYLERRYRPDMADPARGSTSSYIELTTREEQFEVL